MSATKFAQEFLVVAFDAQGNFAVRREPRRRVFVAGSRASARRLLLLSYPHRGEAYAIAKVRTGANLVSPFRPMDTAFFMIARVLKDGWLSRLTMANSGDKAEMTDLVKKQERPVAARMGKIGAAASFALISCA